MVQITSLQKQRAYDTMAMGTLLVFSEIHRAREQHNGFVASLLPPHSGTWGKQIRLEHYWAPVMRDLLGIAVVKTHWKSVTVLVLGRETSTGLEEKEKEQSCCTSVFSLPFCISIKFGLLRVEGTLPQSCLLMFCMILKFTILLDQGAMSLAYYRSFSQVKPKEQANSNCLEEANCGDLVD